jgi:NADH-quinone oxidoreductase subunit C
MSHLPRIARPAGPERFQTLLGARLLEVRAQAGETTLVIDRAALPEVLQLLRDAEDLLFEQLMDICGADYPERAERFDVNYHLLSVAHNLRLRVKVTTDEEQPVPSVVALFPVAGWFEREVWDCYGVLFEGNPDLRRILTDYGFEGHPFRKDFPLTGHVELRYSEEQGRVIYEPVTLKQDFRNFDFLSPWEGGWALPGDEKADDNRPPEGAA